MKRNKNILGFSFRILPLWGLGGLALLLSVSVNGQTLEEYLQTAAETNPRVRSAYSEFEVAMLQAPQVASLPDPTLTMSAFGTMIETRLGAQMARFSLMQMVPWFGTLQAKEDAANLRAEAAFQQYLDLRNQVFYDVKSAYAEIYALDKIIQLKKENLEILNSYRELALSGFRSGNSPMVNVVKVDIEREAAKTEIELLQDQRIPLQTRFNLLLRRSPREAIIIQDTLTFSYFNDHLENEKILEGHPTLTSLENQKRSYEIQKTIAQKEGLPMIGLGIDYSVISKRTDADPHMNGQDAVMPMVSVTLPIFRKRINAAKKEAEFMTRNVEEQKEAQKNELQNLLETTVYELNRAKKLIALYERQLESSDQANSLLISSFSNATGNFEDVLEMNQDILLLQTQKIEAIKEGFIADARLDYLFSKTEQDEP